MKIGKGDTDGRVEEKKWDERLDDGQRERKMKKRGTGGWRDG